mgnify:CR=1 FL=1
MFEYWQGGGHDAHVVLDRRARCCGRRTRSDFVGGPLHSTRVVERGCHVLSHGIWLRRDGAGGAWRRSR